MTGIPCSGTDNAVALCTCPFGSTVRRFVGHKGAQRARLDASSQYASSFAGLFRFQKCPGVLPQRTMAAGSGIYAQVKLLGDFWTLVP